MNTRLNQLQNYLIEQKFDAGLISSRNNIFYFSNFDYEPHERFVGMIVFPNQDPVFLTPQMEIGLLETAGWEYKVLSYTDSEDPWLLLKSLVTGLKSIAVEKNEISLDYAESLKELVPKAELYPMDEKLSLMRLIKEEEELSCLRDAAMYADYGVQVGINALKEGISELEVLGIIELELKKKGIKEMSFSPMVLFGYNSSNPHGVPGRNTLSKGDPVLFDLGVKYKGYCSDITRTVIFKEAGTEVKRMYNAVLEANYAGIEACQVGNCIADIDRASRLVINNAGYGEYFPHRIGHGLGIDVHEKPSMSENNQDFVVAGMVLTIEPGVYLPNIGGIRIEDDIVVTEAGPEILTKFPKNLLIVEGDHHE
ncbi:M24 family metallopeptidase [Rossellomorea sp. BNER]|uniref:M24 family metallopeptidase n=1 Tax=Rossellomorea sp. BNER TaxID=2962031 RepID=UPI003AF231AF|nr:Xaa-Pro peptidase family protein [Rossellomorea sp. BNER]